VSLGLPVYNGDNFLLEAIDSIRSQTFEDWELIISDNASVDTTESICRSLAAEDPRVHYHRQPRNLGAGPNYNFVFHRAQGRYFKWVSHDDRIDPDFLERCLGRLEAEPATVLCHGLLVDTDEAGETIGEFRRHTTSHRDPAQRFRGVIRQDHNCAEVFGLIRADVLSRSILIKDYTDSDRTLLAQLVLAGPFAEEPSTRYYRRMHTGKSDRAYRDYFERSRWFNPDNARKLVMPAAAQALDLFRIALAAELSPRQRIRCLRELARHVYWRRGLHVHELSRAFNRIFRRRSTSPAT
jgi:glycosyltransferase involved in cell wall biosynthesis